VPSFRRWAAPRPPDLTEYACIRRNRVGEGKARPMALTGAVNRPHLRRKCLRQKPTPICCARNGSLARQGELAAVFGDGLRLTATVWDVGRTKKIKAAWIGVSGPKASRAPVQSIVNKPSSRDDNYLISCFKCAAQAIVRIMFSRNNSCSQRTHSVEQSSFSS